MTSDSLSFRGSDSVRIRKPILVLIPVVLDPTLSTSSVQRLELGLGLFMREKMVFIVSISMDFLIKNNFHGSIGGRYFDDMFEFTHKWFTIDAQSGFLTFGFRP